MALFGLKKEESSEKKQDGKSTVSVLGSKSSGDFNLKRPLVTEKALILEGKRQYVFEVSKNSSKPIIKKEIENLYGVKVQSVNIINIKRKTRMFRGKLGFNPGFKKAVVQLKEGYKIEIAPR